MPAPLFVLLVRPLAQGKVQVLRGRPEARLQEVLRPLSKGVEIEAQAVPRAGDQEGEGDQGWTVEINFRKFLIQKQIDTQIDR